MKKSNSWAARIIAASVIVFIVVFFLFFKGCSGQGTNETVKKDTLTTVTTTNVVNVYEMSCCGDSTRRDTTSVRGNRVLVDFDNGYVEIFNEDSTSTILPLAGRE